MNDEQHKEIVDYIVKVFASGDHHVDILNKQTLTFEEVGMIIEEVKKEKEKLNEQFEQILAENENILQNLHNSGNDYYFHHRRCTPR